MVTEIKPQVYKVMKADLQKNITRIYGEINRLNQYDKSVCIVTEKNQEDINGSREVIKGLRWDDRKYSLIIVKKI